MDASTIPRLVYPRTGEERARNFACAFVRPRHPAGRYDATRPLSGSGRASHLSPATSGPKRLREDPRGPTRVRRPRGHRPALFNASMTQLEYALAIAASKWPVFPCNEDKQPLTSNGFKDASTHVRRITMWWTVWPDALIGVALPQGTLGVDIDDHVAFDASGLDLPPSPLTQRTRSGGEHRVYKTNGHGDPPQQVKVHPGVDTRVGGRGYLIAWSPDVWVLVHPNELTDSPEWPFEEVARRRARSKNAVPAEEQLVGEDGVTHRTDITRWVGTLRGIANNTDDEILQLLLGRLKAGQIVDGDETRPWTPADMEQIVRGTKDWQGPEREREFSVRRVKAERPKRPPLTLMSAEDLLKKELTPLEYLVEGILPEGLGVIAGAPKVGKSWLVYQAAVEVANGGDFLGRPCECRDVLYYTLEDGERRLQERLTEIKGRRHLDLSRLSLCYTAPRIGDGLEEDITGWLEERPGGLVIIDVLAMVRPKSSGKGSAYDEDYSVIGPLHEVTRLHPVAAIIVVTHDRKAGSDDWMTTVTGTRGIVGAADWVWVVKRGREKPEGVVHLTGRDVRDMHIDATFLDGQGPWGVGAQPTPGTSGKQKDIIEALLTEGDHTAREIAVYLYSNVTGKELVNRTNAVTEGLNKLYRDGHVTKRQFVHGRGVPYHALTDEDRAARRASVRGDEVIEIRRVSRAGAPESAQPGAQPARIMRAPARAQEEVPSIQSIESIPEREGMEPVDEMDTPSGARGGAAAPARTRARDERRLS